MQVMKEVYISVLENWIVQGDFELEFGYCVMQQILNQQYCLMVVFCGGDIMVMGVICVVDEMGLWVLQDILLIGYDNVCNVCYFSLVLIIIYQLKDFLGEVVFNMLLDCIVNKCEELQFIEVYFCLVECCLVVDGLFVDYCC